jgi:hypothetical protein
MARPSKYPRELRERTVRAVAESWCNTERPHESIDDLTPIQAEEFTTLDQTVSSRAGRSEVSGTPGRFRCLSSPTPRRNLWRDSDVLHFEVLPNTL